jgi:CheY-like chemotaxis protein
MTAPTVYFIDDSATMREVIKIAFRRENIHVVACHDAATALSAMESNPPDVVISDVIMPEKDGYEVCQHIKQHPSYGKTPVILMSGVVNRAVAERAFAVKADELIRKPFQPQDLITRVKHLLNGKPAPPPAPAATSVASPLSTIFASPANGRAQSRVPPISPAAAAAATIHAAAAAPVMAPAPRPGIQPPQAVATAVPPPPPQPAVPPSVAVAPPPSAATAGPLPAAKASAPPTRPASTVSSLDMQKLKIEVLRLEHLVKKLHAELEAEREYSRALEAHIKTLQDAE